MAWIVTSWRTERLEALLDAQAREAARAILAAAERDARRAGRAAARETADAVAHLQEIERAAEATRAAVGEQRRALRRDRRDDEIRIVAARRGGHGRARLRESPLAELFRATATR